MTKNYKYFFLILLFCPIFVGAQTDDNILWTKLSVQKAVGQRTTLFVAPIVRFDQDFSEYQNFSLDYTARYRLTDNFSVQLTGRTWFLPNGTHRQFIWPDLLFKKEFKSWRVNSLLRWHYAVDIKEVADADFIRWKTTLTYLNLGIIQLNVGVEPWLRLNSVGALQRVRYSAGVIFKFSKRNNISLHWWREKSINLKPQRNDNIFVLTLSHTLKNSTRK